MAYGTPETNRRRIVALAGVGVVHGVMAVALLTGFAGGIIQEIKRQSLQTWNYMPPPPPPRPEPTVQPSAHPHDRLPMPDPYVPLRPQPDTDFHIDIAPLPTGGSGLGTGTLPPLQPTASPSPRFTPRAAAPLGMPGRWVSDSDYPTAALRRGEQGAAGFEVTIGPDGRVRDCRITRSSGSASLDAATCAKVSERAQFTPARDENGDLVTGRYANVIRWRIPE
ncbi:energy transducer TonB [Novosphingobium sp. AAP93]|uniref:energy transducer TonB n=1 Tax=Novosphingobium sp. AAP93 TaxID=1523427 RepID=UPI0006B9DE49|nr:energy transducer TonB [Novosphingobium sp. AAP93]KPF81940.1 hypothetical protein IP83_12475 [Novosphingobium sp. AAP93]